MLMICAETQQVGLSAYNHSLCSVYQLFLISLCEYNYILTKINDYDDEAFLHVSVWMNVMQCEGAPGMTSLTNIGFTAGTYSGSVPI